MVKPSDPTYIHGAPFKWPGWVKDLVGGIPYIIGWELGGWLYHHFTITFH